LPEKEDAQVKASSADGIPVVVGDVKASTPDLTYVPVEVIFNSVILGEPSSTFGNVVKETENTSQIARREEESRREEETRRQLEISNRQEEISRQDDARRLLDESRNQIEAQRVQLDAIRRADELRVIEVQLSAEQAARIQAQSQAESSQPSKQPIYDQSQGADQSPLVVFTVPAGHALPAVDQSNGIHVAIANSGSEEQPVKQPSTSYPSDYIVVDKPTTVEITYPNHALPVVETPSGLTNTQPGLKSGVPGEVVLPARESTVQSGHNIANLPNAQNIDSLTVSGKGDAAIKKVDFEAVDSKTYTPSSGTSDWLSDASAKYGYSSGSPATGGHSAASGQSNIARQTDFATGSGSLNPNSLGDSLTGSFEPKPLQLNTGVTPDANTAGLSLTGNEPYTLGLGVAGSVDPNAANIGAGGVYDPNTVNLGVNGLVDPNAAALGLAGYIDPTGTQTNSNQLIDPNAANSGGTNSGSLTDGLIGVDGQPISNMQGSQPDSQSAGQAVAQNSGTTQVPDWLEQATQHLGLSPLEVKAPNPDHKVLEPESDRRPTISSDAGIVSQSPVVDASNGYQSDRIDQTILNNPIIADSNSANNYGTVNSADRTPLAGNDYGIVAADQQVAAEQERIQRIMDQQARDERDLEQERLTRLDIETSRREAELRLSQDELEKIKRREEDENRRKKESEERIEKTEDKRHSDEILTVIAIRQQAEAEAKAAAQRMAEERQLAQELVRKDNLQEKYTVQPNDTIIKIALRKFKDVRLVDLIYELNKGKIEVRWEGGKRVYIVKPGTVLTMPSAKQVREWTARLNNVGSRTSHQGLEARSSVAADQRKANIEKVLGKIREAVDGGAEKSYPVRLGDTLRSIAMKHPDLRDVTLWPLLAKKNGLSTDTDSKGAPLAVVIRGSNIVLPTREEIEMFRSNTAELKPVAREPQTYVGAYGSLFNVATKPCGGCRRLISENANLCPACGYVFELQQEPSIESQATTFSMTNGDTTLSLPEHTVVVSSYEEQTTVVDFEQTTLSLPEQSKANGSAIAKSDNGSSNGNNSAGKTTGSNSNSRAIDSYVTGGHNSAPSVPTGGNSSKSGSANTGSGTGNSDSRNTGSRSTGSTGSTGNTGSSISSNLSRSLDERENATELSRTIETLNDNCRLVKTEKEYDGMNFICQQLQVLTGDEWTPVLSYEVGNDSSVRHEYHKDGRKKTIKIDLPSGAVGEMVSNELTSNWLDYCQRYLAGRKLSA
jgi:hypothetical protein